VPYVGGYLLVSRHLPFLWGLLYDHPILRRGAQTASRVDDSDVGCRIEKSQLAGDRLAGARVAPAHRHRQDQHSHRHGTA
jgi:hypothetical protein